jgi:secreted trypsin-like serine protease
MRLGFKVLLLILMLDSQSFAVLGGRTLCTAASADDKLIQQATVRLVVKFGDDGYKTLCSGSLIGNGDILTAGHCLYDKPGDKEKSMWLGTGLLYAEIRNPKTGATQLIKVADGDGEWSQKSAAQGGRDIAVMKLAASLPPDSPKLPMANDKCDDQKRIMAGFGLDQNGQSPSCVKVADYTEDNSDESYSRLQMGAPGNTGASVDDLKNRRMISRSQSGQGCTGDSGGPVMCKVHGRLSIVSVDTNHRFAASFSASGGPTDSEDNKEVVRTSCEPAQLNISTRVSSEDKFIDYWRRSLNAPEVAGGSGAAPSPAIK